jgi:uncharacterized membrane protein YraQ (UPF0718 family)
VHILYRNDIDLAEVLLITIICYIFPSRILFFNLVLGLVLVVLIGLITSNEPYGHNYVEYHYEKQIQTQHEKGREYRLSI